MSDDEKQIEELAERTRKLLFAFIKWAGGLLDLGLTLSSRIEESGTLKKLHSALQEIKNDVELLIADTSYKDMKSDIIEELIFRIEKEMRKRKVRGEKRKGYMEVLAILRDEGRGTRKVKKVKFKD